MADFKHEVVKELGVLSENRKTDWRKLFRIVKWGDYPAKYDIRDWSPDDMKTSRGVTLTADETKALIKLLQAEFGGTDE